MKTFLLLLFLLFSFAVNAQQQWFQQISGTTINLESVKAVNNDVIWAAGDNGLVLNTSNGGATWEIKTPTQTSYDNYCITSFDINTAIVIGCTLPPGTGAKIWKTTDSGNTWMEKYYSANNWGNNIHFFDSNNGIYLGDPEPFNSAQWNILTTTDGGNNWNRVPPSNYPPSDSACGEMGILHSYGVYGDNVWFSTYYDYCSTKNNRIFRSTDKGYNWTVFDMPYRGGVGADISFSSATYGLAISYSGAIAGIVSCTTDSGTTWTVLDTIDIAPWAVRNVPGYANFFLAVGEDASFNGKSFYSNDKGNLWNPLLAPTQSSLIDVSLTQDSAWAVGYNGTILTLDLLPIITEVEEEFLSSIPSDYMLSQNYPNPFNPTTKINYQIPKISFVTLKVYDVLGNEIATLINKEKPLGSYEVEFNTSSLSSGVYFYKLQAGSFTETKKMLLLK